MSTSQTLMSGSLDFTSKLQIQWAPSALAPVSSVNPIVMQATLFGKYGRFILAIVAIKTSFFFKHIELVFVGAR